jgi:DNA-binding NarL/FixJ family response regulator
MLAELRRSLPKTKVNFLRDFADQAKLIDAFCHGASGSLETKDRDKFLAKGIHAVSNGETWMPLHFATKIVERLRPTR